MAIGLLVLMEKLFMDKEIGENKMRKMPDYKIEYGSYEWWLYHHPDNEKPVPLFILLSCFFFICKGGGVYLLIMWGWYFSWASANNRKLDNDPKVQKRRENCIYWTHYFKENPPKDR
jgi:hypothetical protein